MVRWRLQHRNCKNGEGNQYNDRGAEHHHIIGSEKRRYWCMCNNLSMFGPDLGSWRIWSVEACWNNDLVFCDRSDFVVGLVVRLF